MLLAILLASCAHAEMEMTVRELKRGNDDIREVRRKVRLANYQVSFNCTENQAVPGASWAVEPEAGRWQRHIFFLSGGKKFGGDAIAWETRRDRQTNAGIRIPRFKGDESDGFMEIDAVALDDFPDWVFFRYTNFHFVYLGVALGRSPMDKEKRQLFAAYPGGTLALGDDIPWRNRLPGFNAMAFYSRGGRDTEQSELLVFDGISQIGTARWQKDDDRCTLSFLAGPDNTIYFAMGVRKGGSGEKTLAPDFLAQEQEKVLSALRSINWDPVFDLNLLRKEYDETGELLRKNPNPEMQKKYDALQIPVSNSREDIIRAVAIRGDLAVIKKVLLDSQLGQLFD